MLGGSICKRIKEKYSSVKGFCADEGFRGTCASFVTDVLGSTMDIAKKMATGFTVLKNRWIVERTNAWFNGARRLAKDFEILTATEENFIRIDMIHIALAKL